VPTDRRRRPRSTCPPCVRQIGAVSASAPARRAPDRRRLRRRRPQTRIRCAEGISRRSSRRRSSPSTRGRLKQPHEGRSDRARTSTTGASRPAAASLYGAWSSSRHAAGQIIARQGALGVEASLRSASRSVSARRGRQARASSTRRVPKNISSSPTAGRPACGQSHQFRHPDAGDRQGVGIPDSFGPSSRGQARRPRSQLYSLGRCCTRSDRAPPFVARSMRSAPATQGHPPRRRSACSFARRGDPADSRLILKGWKIFVAPALTLRQLLGEARGDLAATRGSRLRMPPRSLSCLRTAAARAGALCTGRRRRGTCRPPHRRPSSDTRGSRALAVDSAGPAPQPSRRRRYRDHLQPRRADAAAAVIVPNRPQAHVIPAAAAVITSRRVGRCRAADGARRADRRAYARPPAPTRRPPAAYAPPHRRPGDGSAAAAVLGGRWPRQQQQQHRARQGAAGNRPGPNARGKFRRRCGSRRRARRGGRRASEAPRRPRARRAPHRGPLQGRRHHHRRRRDRLACAPPARR